MRLAFPSEIGVALFDTNTTIRKPAGKRPSLVELRGAKGSIGVSASVQPWLLLLDLGWCVRSCPRLPFFKPGLGRSEVA